MSTVASAGGLGRTTAARQLLRDAGLPLAAYYGLHACGASNLVALVAGTVLSGVVLLAEIARTRKMDLFAALVLAGFAVGLALTFLSGDVRFMIAKDSLTTALIGGAFLVSSMIGTPLTYLVAKRGMAGDPERAAAFEQKYRTVPLVRRTLLLLTVVWGVGLLGESALRVLLVYRLSIPTMMWLSPVMMVITFGALIGITVLVIRRAAAVAAREQAPTTRAAAPA
jgi:hypothetical protein